MNDIKQAAELLCVKSNHVIIDGVHLMSLKYTIAVIALQEYSNK